MQRCIGLVTWTSLRSRCAACQMRAISLYVLSPRCSGGPMKRRDFITTAAIAAGATLTPFQLAFAAQKTSRFQLSMIGAASTAKVSSDSMRVHFDAWVPAQTGAVLSAMDVSAMFYLADSSLAS